MTNKMDSKALVLLLEGDSDRLTFEHSFSMLLEENDPEKTLQVFVFRGDITINDINGDPIESDDILENVATFIRRELRVNGLVPSDLLGIVHLGDLDAAYCDDSSVIFSSASRKPFYDAEKCAVMTKNVAATIAKNKRKREALNTLMQTNQIEFGPQLEKGLLTVPYRYFYFGINLEHSYYGLANCTTGQKEQFGLDFDDKHAPNLQQWIAFVDALPSEGETYAESCKAARQKENAFRPMTNLRFALEFIISLITKG